MDWRWRGGVPRVWGISGLIGIGLGKAGGECSNFRVWGPFSLIHRWVRLYAANDRDGEAVARPIVPSFGRDARAFVISS